MGPMGYALCESRPISSDLPDCVARGAMCMWYMYSTLKERELVFVSMIAVSLGMNGVSSWVLAMSEVLASVKGVHQTLKGEGALCFVDTTRVGIKNRFVD